MSFGDKDVTQETEDVPPLAARVKTLQEAVQLSLQDGLNEKCLFTFARAIKAFEITINRRLVLAEWPSVFSLWWGAAKPMLPPDADFDEWRLDFEDTFAKTHAALGANSLQEAIRRADADPMPTQAARYSSSKLRRLVAVCYNLQLLQVNSPFFLCVRDAAKIIGTKGLPQASAWLAGLVRDGILTKVEPGTRKRATRFRFNLPAAEPAADTQAPPPVKAAGSDTPAPQPPPAANIKSKSARSPVPRKQSTYDLVERKKALQELIKGLGHKDYWDPDTRKRSRQLGKLLEQVNIELAGMTG